MLVHRLAVRLSGELRRTMRPDPGRGGYAVRIDWPAVAGRPVCHDFSQFTPDLRRVLRRAERTRRFWARGPLRPLAVTVAPMTWAEFAAHGPECTSLLCRTVAPLLGMAGGERACVQQRG